jgi:hypothetical protein
MSEMNNVDGDKQPSSTTLRSPTVASGLAPPLNNGYSVRLGSPKLPWQLRVPTKLYTLLNQGGKRCLTKK